MAFGPGFWGAGARRSNARSIRGTTGAVGPAGAVTINAAQDRLCPCCHLCLCRLRRVYLAGGPLWGGVWGATGLVIGDAAHGAGPLTDDPIVERLGGRRTLVIGRALRFGTSISLVSRFCLPTGDLPYFMAMQYKVSFVKILLVTLIRFAVDDGRGRGRQASGGCPGWQLAALLRCWAPRPLLLMRYPGTGRPLVDRREPAIFGGVIAGNVTSGLQRRIDADLKQAMRDRSEDSQAHLRRATNLHAETYQWRRCPWISDAGRWRSCGEAKRRLRRRQFSAWAPPIRARGGTGQYTILQNYLPQQLSEARK